MLDCKSSVKVDGDVIQIDPLLFQRLTLVADNLEHVFRFELCSYPQALFSGTQFKTGLCLSGLFCLIKFLNCLWILSMC